jgi:PIN domain nuclease of toxin-antitoxin system
MLLDTQVLIWHAIGGERFTKTAIRAIEKGGHFYSHASVWELAIKSGLNKVSLILGGERVLARQFITYVASRLQLAPLRLEFDDLVEVESLPEIHKDPFDRLLVVQARRRSLPIISSDEIFERYGAKRIW